MFHFLIAHTTSELWLRRGLGRPCAWGRRPGPGRKGPGPGRGGSGLDRRGGLRPMSLKVFAQTTSIFQYFTANIAFYTVYMFLHMVSYMVGCLKSLPSTGQRLEGEL